MANVSKLISTRTVDSSLIEYWNNLIHDLLNNHVTNEVSISPVLAEKYKFDLDGLFANEFNIQEEYIYPIIRVNGYDSSNCYDGGKLKLLLLDTSVLTTYYRMYKRNKK